MTASHWDEDTGYPVKDWQYEVANDDTRLGYAAWVENQRALAVPATFAEALLHPLMHEGSPWGFTAEDIDGFEPYDGAGWNSYWDSQVDTVWAVMVRTGRVEEDDLYLEAENDSDGGRSGWDMNRYMDGRLVGTPGYIGFRISKWVDTDLGCEGSTATGVELAEEIWEALVTLYDQLGSVIVAITRKTEH